MTTTWKCELRGQGPDPSLLKCENCGRAFDAHKPYPELTCPVVQYVDNRGESVTWDPADLKQGYFFIVLSKFPEKGNQRLQLEGGIVSLNYESVDAAAAGFAALIQRFPGYDWKGCNPRVVWARCAFDASKHGVNAVPLKGWDVLADAENILRAKGWRREPSCGNWTKGGNGYTVRELAARKHEFSTYERGVLLESIGFRSCEYCGDEWSQKHVCAGTKAADRDADRREEDFRD